MKKTLISALVTAFAFTPFLGMIPTARAATMNTAIRGQSSFTVYWYANDGKRYPFPNAGTYFSWFNSFDQVEEVSDFELTSIPLANENVTYRPGAKLVKIQTSPMVYAVAKGGVLRHVTSESVARSIYGADWNLKVHDIPDVFFSNYTVGAPIYNTSDYNVSNEYHGVSHPSDSLRVSNGTGQTGDLVLNTTRTNINPGEAVTLSVTNVPGYGSGYRVEIYDTRTNGLVRTCSLPMSNCEVTVYPQRNNTENSVQYYAALRNSSSSTLKSGYSPIVYLGSSQTGTLTLTSDRTTVRSGQLVNLHANYNANIPNGARIEIKEVRSNAVIKTCYNVTSCSTARTPYQRPSSYSSTQYVVVVIDTNGNQIATQHGPTIYFDSSNGQTDTLTLTSDRTNITNGQSVTLNANYTNSLNGGRIEIVEFRTRTIVKTCHDTSFCTVTVYPYQTDYSSTQYVATVSDSSGAEIAIQYGSMIYFNGTTGLTVPVITSPTEGQNISSATRLVILQWNARGVRDVIEVQCESCSSPTWSWSQQYVVYADEFAGSSYSASRHLNGLPIDGRYRVRVNSYDASNRESGWSNWVTFTVNGTTGSSNDGTNYISDLRLETSNTSIVRGATVKLTVNAFNVGNWNYSGNRIEIRDIRNGNVVRTCYDQSWCVADVTVYQQSTENIIQYEARLYDRNGRYIMNELSPAIHFVN